MKLYCVVLTGVVCMWAGVSWAACGPAQAPAVGQFCDAGLPPGVVPGPGLDSPLHGVSFATASEAGFERAVLHAGKPPVAAVDAAALPIGPRGEVIMRTAFDNAEATRSAEALAASRGGLVTASAVPEPNGLLMALAGMAVVAVLLSRRSRRD